ncbi:TPA: quorum-sensing phosphorelay protein LuxU [Vibrio parahaemolyticus]|uniref:quorum-sensing phosphorelay protein LuxU n=1 Tax=Vibrio parahaemolyticus TaxID=670 RepID=UPI0007A03456|nr:quorum-sensing phosphorelay protein LuxU [Vibrio parahaemolyticus]EGR1143227.1 Hpt domain-containing protein [Vibrio parahaemolyticus]EGR2356347.1 Hpt domain-containing protein [Vibrio parahaemolyticus]EGR3424617.1 Hpt domain-containing protein [Vibrio parahaemolyticus]EIS4856601.1 Hpt domain-containing protein [Vibrio parahaemolyticus]ELB1648090.1 Hpt domain-containing protein [Vibrio parahaemolyticus]
MTILNQQKIDELSMEIGSDNVPVLLDIFLGEMDTYIDNLSQLEGSERLVYLKEISHALKSSAASFGADSLCELAMSIDKKAKSGELVEQGSEVYTMLERLNETRDAYRSWTQ